MATQSSQENILTGTTQQAVERSLESGLISRIWKKDATVWKSDPDIVKTINNRLGWLEAPEQFSDRLAEILDFAEEVRNAGYTNVVLLGMGGSSLCVEVIRDTMGVSAGYPAMLVLDSTHPDQILRVERAIDPERTLFIVASKSGTTLESDSLYTYFWTKLEDLGGARGAHFCAITDPGTILERLGVDQHFRKVFINPPDIGGRFSVLSYFGLVPAALMGVDVVAFVGRAISEVEKCKAENASNPGLVLGAFLVSNADEGRDKLSLRTDDALRSFGYWAEQLVAESTGKQGKGILPIEGESELPADVVTADRMTVRLGVGADSARAESDVEMDIVLSDVYDLSAQFFRWEFATAVAGALLEINPFDEPNVAESKAQTNSVLSQYEGRSPLTFPEVKCTSGGITIAGEDVTDASPAANIDQLVKKNQKDGSYIAIMAFLDRSPEMIQALDELRKKLTIKYKLPVTVGFGPRFLHSTGQLHKGGPDTGIFIQLIDTPKEDAQVVGKPYSFGTLVLGQAIGDFEALRLKHKPVLNFNLGADALRSVKALA